MNGDVMAIDVASLVYDAFEAKVELAAFLVTFVSPAMVPVVEAGLATAVVAASVRRQNYC